MAEHEMFNKPVTTAPNIPNYITPVDGITGDLIEQETQGENAPLFPYGYGLSYANASPVPALYENLNELELDPRDFGCGMSAPDTGVAELPLEIFGKRAAKDEFVARISVTQMDGQRFLFLKVKLLSVH